jgi:hypothetical protein
MSITYRNNKTGQLVPTDGPKAVFDRSSQWERVEAEAEQQESGTELVDLTKLKRGELNELAAALGVEDPDKLPNAGAVIEAIKEAEAEQQESGTE